MTLVGLWPTEPPFAAGERVLVWHEGTTASAVLAASCEAYGLDWEPFVAHVPGAPARALDAAFAQLAALGRAAPRVHALPAHLLSPPGWASLAPEAAARAARAVALPVTQEGAHAPWAPGAARGGEAPRAQPVEGSAAFSAGASGQSSAPSPGTLRPGEAPVPLALQLRAIEAVLAPWGPLTVWAPLAGLDFLAVARLALALGVDFAHTWDCVAEAACGRCAPCAARARAWRQLGIAAPPDLG